MPTIHVREQSAAYKVQDWVCKGHNSKKKKKKKIIIARNNIGHQPEHTIYNNILSIAASSRRFHATPES